MKTKFKFFKRKLPQKYEGLEKRLNSMSFFLIIIACIIYFLISLIIYSEFLQRGKSIKGESVIIVFGVMASIAGLGFIESRPPKQRIIMSIIILTILIMNIYIQISFLKK